MMRRGRDGNSRTVVEFILAVADPLLSGRNIDTLAVPFPGLVTCTQPRSGAVGLSAKSTLHPLVFCVFRDLRLVQHPGRAGP